MPRFFHLQVIALNIVGGLITYYIIKRFVATHELEEKSELKPETEMKMPIINSSINGVKDILKWVMKQ